MNCTTCKHFNPYSMMSGGWCGFAPPKWMLPERLLNLPENVSIDRDVTAADVCSLHEETKCY